MKYVVLMETMNFFSSVTRLCKKFKCVVDSVKDAPHACRPKTAASQKMVEKGKDLIATDARFTNRYIAKCVGISVRAAHTILRYDLKMRSARWIPHLLIKGQKHVLKQFPKLNDQSFAFTITGDET
jgi:hypothetical protein